MLKQTKPHNDLVDRFAMHWLGDDILRQLVREKSLNYGHIGLLYLLMGRMDPNTGRINVTAAAMAEQLDKPYSQVRAYISKLLQHQLIARWRDPETGQACFLIHPYIASVGGPQRRGYLWKQFSEAIDGRHLHPVPGDIEAA
jgi:hypothetical protein